MDELQNLVREEALEFLPRFKDACGEISWRVLSHFQCLLGIFDCLNIRIDFEISE